MKRLKSVWDKGFSVYQTPNQLTTCMMVRKAIN